MLHTDHSHSNTSSESNETETCAFVAAYCISVYWYDALGVGAQLLWDIVAHKTGANLFFYVT